MNILLKQKIFIVLLLMHFFVFNAGIVKLTLFQTMDELILLICTFGILFLIFLDVKKRKISKLNLLIVIYIIYQIVNYFISPFSLDLKLVLMQSLINLKVFLVSYFMIYLFSEQSNKYIKSLYFTFIALFIIGFGLNFLFQETWNVLLDEKVSTRNGWLRPIGYFASTGMNGDFFMITFITLFLLYAKKPIIKVKNTIVKYFTFIIIDFLMAYPLTVRKGMFVNIPFTFYIISLLKKRQAILFTISATIFFVIFLFLVKDTTIMADTIDNFTNFTHDEHTYIRGLVVYYGFNLFLEFFPFGTGTATFGTVLSQYNTLAVYEYVNLPLDRIYYNSGRLDGVYDSGMFSMLAENGFLGMILMLSIIYYFFKYNKNRLDSYNYQVFKIITIFSILLAIVNPNWQNGFFTTFYSINLLFIYTKNNIYRINGKWIKFKHEEKTNENIRYT